VTMADHLAGPGCWRLNAPAAFLRVATRLSATKEVLMLHQDPEAISRRAHERHERLLREAADDRAAHAALERQPGRHWSARFSLAKRLRTLASAADSVKARTNSWSLTPPGGAGASTSWFMYRASSPNEHAGRWTLGDGIASPTRPRFQPTYGALIAALLLAVVSCGGAFALGVLAERLMADDLNRSAAGMTQAATGDPAEGAGRQMGQTSLSLHRVLDRWFDEPNARLNCLAPHPDSAHPQLCPQRTSTSR
jgi:hypothetical protein